MKKRSSSPKRVEPLRKREFKSDEGTDWVEMQRDVAIVMKPFATPPEFGRSMVSLTRDLVLMGLVLVAERSLSAYLPTPVMAVLYAVVMGTVATGMWVLGHECGHGAFGSTALQNDTVGFFVHSFLLVPYFAWKYTHNKHHKYTNHMVLGETHVPSTRGGAAMNKAVIKALGEDSFVLIRLVAQLLLGWPLYLFRNETGGRTTFDLKTRLNRKKFKDHFNPTSQIFPPALQGRIALGTVGILAMIGGLWTVGWPALYYYWGPYLVVNFWLVLYTWLQHTHPDLPHYGASEFNFLRGAFATIDRPYPWVIDQLHHHIGTTHVAHHINYRIPHYRAVECTAALKAKFPDHYRYDPMGITAAAFRSAKECLFVEGVEGIQYWKNSKDFNTKSATAKSSHMAG